MADQLIDENRRSQITDEDSLYDSINPEYGEDLDLFYEEEDSLQQEEDAAAKSFDLSSLDGSSGDALIACINLFGTIDLEWMQQQANTSIDQLIADLEGRAMFQDPELCLGESAEGKLSYEPLKGWVLYPRYLSGNLRGKLQKAKEAQKKLPGLFDSNVRALEELLPDRIHLRDVHVSLGAPWIPADVYSDFIEDLLGAYYTIELRFDPISAQWKFSADGNQVSYVENHYSYGTERMSALKIIQATMNARTVKVHDMRMVTNEKGEVKEKAILNKNETLQAQEKQRLILQEFEDYVYSDVHLIERLENCYNDEYGGFVSSPYNGDFLNLPGLNPQITLYPHQKNAIARILLSDNNVLLSHEVGTGKTYEMVCAAHELHRMGISRRNMTVVPNNVLQDIIAAHQKLYPQDVLITVTPKSFTPAKRAEILERIRDDDYAACYIGASSFDLIKLSKAYRIEQQENEIYRLKAAMQEADYAGRRALNVRISKLSEKLMEFREEEPELNAPGFDELGIETLFVDEAHHYKNIPLHSSADNIVGMHNTGSVKCRNMLEKTRIAKRLVFSTGTPLTNSMADLFVLQTYLQPDLLKAHSIDTFDQWINTFAERDTSFEIDVDAVNLRLMTRFSIFHNLGELMSLFCEVCDFHYADPHSDLLPDFHGYTDIQVPLGKVQEQYLKKLVARTDKIRTKSVSRHKDNLLKITSDGRKCALDIRLTGKKLSKKERHNTKISYCAAKAYELYQEYPNTAQLIFSDIGTPCEGFNVYDTLKQELMDLGIPEQEIAYIHDAQSEAARTKLFAAVNKGKIRILIGSTFKLGIGVNVQERLIALHHLSVPWRPADMVQREGRIVRQGNLCPEVFIFRYVTKGTFDAYSWQLLENKQRFISSFLSGSMKNRSAEDISDAVLSYADIKAIAIGNPLIKKRVETANTLTRMQNAFRQRQNQLHRLEEELEGNTERIKDQKNTLKRILRDIKTVQANQQKISNQDRRNLGGKILRAFKTMQYYWQDVEFGSYKGFRLYIPTIQKPGIREAALQSPSNMVYRVKISSDNPQGITHSLDYALSHLDKLAENTREAIRRLQDNSERAVKELESGNSYQEKVEQLEQTLKLIDARIEESKEEAGGQNA